MPTHGLITTGTGATAAATRTQIGSDITLPAAGPWAIFGLWGQVVRSAGVADEGTGGHLIFDAKSGDLDPDPAPGTYPLLGSPAASSVNSALSVMPLNLWPVEWAAAGKAVVSLYYTNQLAITAAPNVAAGIIFGNEIPTPQPLVFCDGVYGAFASTAEQSIGTITLSEKAQRVVGILAVLDKSSAITVDEEVLATIRLTSDDINLAPAQFPCAFALNPADGTPVGAASMPQCQFMPVDIPVPGGARVQVYATTTGSVTGNAQVRVYLAYN
jgi:hypothetical protein